MQLLSDVADRWSLALVVYSSLTDQQWPFEPGVLEYPSFMNLRVVSTSGVHQLDKGNQKITIETLLLHD